MKIAVLTDSTGKVVGASLCQGVEREIININKLLSTGVTNLTLQVVQSVALIDLALDVAVDIIGDEIDSLDTDS